MSRKGRRSTGWSAAILSDGRIAITNRGTSQVVVFSPAGDLVTAFGRRGDGPGEFKRLWSVYVRGEDTLVVGDYLPWRFTFFTTEGEWIRQVVLNPPVMGRPDFAIPLAAGSGFIAEDPSFDVQDEMSDHIVPLWLYGEDGENTGSVGHFWLEKLGYLARETGYVGNPIFGARASFSHLRDDQILYAAGRAEQLEIWNVGGELQGIIRWQARAREVAAGDADVWRQQKWEALEASIGSRPAMQPVIEAQVGEHLPVADLYQLMIKSWCRAKVPSGLRSIAGPSTKVLPGGGSSILTGGSAARRHGRVTFGSWLWVTTVWSASPETASMWSTSWDMR